MANKMLIDATHPEETRVVVLRGNRVEEFDFESASRRQLRGNIYLAKVTRVEPSLQAAFIDYGGNRHGFLAFSEIHPDYYQIPVADRQALIDEEERAHRDAEAEADRRADMRRRPSRRRNAERHAEALSIEPQGDDSHAPDAAHGAGAAGAPLHGEVLPPEGLPPEGLPGEGLPGETWPGETFHGETLRGETVRGETLPGDWQRETWQREPSPAEALAHDHEAGTIEPPPGAAHSTADEDDDDDDHGGADDAHADRLDPHLAARLTAARPPAKSTTLDPDLAPLDHDDDDLPPGHPGTGTHAVVDEAAAPDLDAGEEAHDDDETHGDDGDAEEEEVVESVGGDDAMEEVPDRAPRHRRQYKIQEVIKRRQIMLVQVVKEERGTKGAALTTYLSLAGRYSVLMPNTARGGGISRKITNVIDRRRLKEIAQELEVPEGMGIILRTAGAARTKTEIKRDFEYLLRAWETVRDLTLNSTAPTLVYEEGSLVKRSIRDLYNKDIDEVVVAGEDAYRDARDFMRMLMPSHAKNVKPYHDNQPVLARYGIESQLDAMFSPVVQLRSGGYIVINQTEALVAIDVNSGRATREHHIEDTALKTNLEASEEIARQLRLRDLAGLIVIDFIDMDEKRNNRAVERRLKDCLKNDRARIQVGRVSHFGLLEMSRQRIRTSVLESSTDKCPHCGGTGHVRSVSSVALQLLRMIEETLQRGATHNIVSRTRSEIALYVLNHKRAHLYDLEHRFQIVVTIASDDTISGQLPFVIEKGEQVHTLEQTRAIAAQAAAIPAVDEPFEAADPRFEDADYEELDEDELGDSEAAEHEEAAGARESAEGGGRRKRRRRRRGGRRGDTREESVAAGSDDEDEAAEAEAQVAVPEQPPYYHHMPAAEEEPSAAEAAAGGEGEAGDLADEDAEAARTDQGDGRRRRRRGRRGGRRNRREEEAELGIVAPEGSIAPVDEDVAHAVADFGEPVDLTPDRSPETSPDLAPDEPEHDPYAAGHGPAVLPPLAAEPVESPKVSGREPRTRESVRFERVPIEPEPSAAEPSAAETPTAETSASEPSAAEAGTTEPPAGRPRTARRPATQRPPEPEPDTIEPDTIKAAAVETAAPRTTVRPGTRPQTRGRGTAETAGPDTAGPETAGPETAGRETAGPETDKPDAPKPDAPRRRSTVREPVAFLVSSGGTVTPAGAPVTPQPAPGTAQETAAAGDEAEPAATPEPAPPRRAGWWAKRVLGDKG